jgi:predicted Zn-ribbon and HTH transcriptional regulator
MVVRMTPLAPGEARRLMIPALLCRCARCGHHWLSGATAIGGEPQVPARCGHCKSVYWRSPRGMLKLGRRPRPKR